MERHPIFATSAPRTRCARLAALGTAALGGQTLPAGVYRGASSLGLTGALTLDGQGIADAVFVLQVGSTLTTATASSVVLIGGAQACHVFWQVGSSATLGTGTHLVGTVFALTSITLTTGATVDGRVLALNGAVTLDTNTISRSACPASAPAAHGISPTIMDLGLTAAGRLQVPPAGFPAGWYTGSPVPGDPGPAVLAGHVDWAGRPGVFADLHRLVAHDQVVITRSDGRTSVFDVTRVERVAQGAFPTAEVYGDLDHPGPRLITCGGSFDRTAHSYEDNVIVFADLVAARS